MGRSDRNGEEGAERCGSERAVHRGDPSAVMAHVEDQKCDGSRSLVHGRNQ